MSTALEPQSNELGDSRTRSQNPAANLVEKRLAAIQRTILRGVCLRAVIAIIAAMILSLLVLTVIDAIIQPEALWLRGILSGTGLLVVAASIKWFFLDSLRKSASRLDVAWNLEQEHPEFEERLTSTLQLANSANDNSTSASLIGLVAEQANERVTNISGKQLGRPSLQPAVITAVGCALLTLLCFAIWHPYLLPSMANLFRPWNSRALPQLAVRVLPGDISISEGESVSVVVEGSSLQGAQLEILHGTAVDSTHPMIVETSTDKAEFALDKIQHDVNYRVRVENRYSPAFRIQVLTRPNIDRVTARLEFPEYTRLGSLQVDDIRGPLQGPVGTRVMLSAVSPASDAQAVMTLDGKPHNAEQVIANDNAAPASWQYQWQLSLTDKPVSQATLALTSSRNVSSVPRQIEFHSIIDRPPAIRLNLQNLTRIALRPDEKLTIPFIATDDYGLTNVQLVTEQAGHNSVSQPLTLPPESREHSGETTLDVQQLELKSQEKLTFWIRVSDNRPEQFGGPQWTDSQRIEIQIDPEAKSLSEQAIRAQHESLERQLAAAVEKLKAAEEHAQQLAAAHDKSPPDSQQPAPNDPHTEQQLQKLRQEIDEARQLLQNFSPEDKSRQLFKPEIEAAENVSNNEVTEAQRQANQIPETTGNEQRQKAEALQAPLKEAVHKLEELQSAIRQRNEDLQRAAQLDQLARQQEQLAKEAQKPESQGEGTKQDAAKKDLQEKQQHVANELQDLVKKDEAAQSEQFQKRADQAEKLSQEASDLQKQQEQLARMNSDDPQQKTDAETQKKQILQMLAREQQAVADQAKQLEQEKRNDPQPPAGGQQPQDKNKEHSTEPSKTGEKPEPQQTGLPQAREKMEDAAKNLREEQPAPAEQAARQALEQLPPDRPASEKTPQGQPQPEQLRRQEQRILDALEAARKNDLNQAASKLQEQIADRTEQLQEKARELLKQPTDDQQNKKTNEEAAKQLQQAQQETKRAEQLAKREAEQEKPQQKQDQGQPQQKQDQGKQQQQQQQQQQPGEQQPEKKDVAKQQEKAADSLQKANESLQQVCKSCKECAKCKNPGGSGGSNPGAPKSDDKSATGKESNSLGQQDSKQLAKAAEAANQAAQSPSEKSTAKAAREVNKLADQAAEKANYPDRRQGQQQNDDKGNKPGDKQSAGGQDHSQQKGQPSGTQPAGTNPAQRAEKGNSQGSDQVSDNGVSGGSSGNWTRAGKKLEGHVLDEKEAHIPEQYKGVVQDYFEELSRLESKQPAAKQPASKENGR